MEAAKFELELDNQPVVVADSVAEDVKGNIVLLIKVQATETKHGGIAQLIHHLQSSKVLIPFAMLVDLENIEFFEWNGNNLSKSACSLKTSDILSYYEPEFGKKRIFYRYLTRLVEAWLRDLAYHWKSETPPGSEQIATIGLLPLLKDGTTKTNVVLRGRVED
ncbi:MAG: hypothetical protein KME19_06970 [Microcoleus vaginatus WJT46-NPBG5]|jgi:hypothetical protein|nr:hypothetical protein [Microcoleus vaginatus WJT46-NPBG5]